MTTFFTKNHEWIRIENGSATVGITAQQKKQLGTLMTVDYLKYQGVVKKGEVVAEITTEGGIYQVHAPVSGEISTINTLLTASAIYIDTAPMDDGWLWMMTPSDESEFIDLMHEYAYKAFIA